MSLPLRARSFSSTAAFSEADKTTGLIGRWIHQSVIPTVAPITSNSASRAPHP
jgi:hypothetical protein